MLVLNQSALLARYKTNPLKIPFRLQGIYFLTDDQVVDILASCANPESAYHFLCELQSKRDTRINVNNSLVYMGSCAKFILAYVNFNKKLEHKNKHVYEYIEKCLCNVRHSREQLTELLDNLSLDDFKKYVIEAKTFRYHDLLHVANDEQVITNIDDSKRLFLHYYFNGKGSWRKTVTPILSAMQMSSEVDHSLGLSTPDIKIEGTSGPIQISDWGGATHTSLLNLVKFLANFIRVHPNENLSKILDALQESVTLHHEASVTFKKAAAEQIVSRYRSNQLTSFTPGWGKHSVSVCIYKNYLCFTDRSKQNINGMGTRIYKIKDSSKISIKTIGNLLDQSSTRDQFMKNLGNIVDIHSPLLRLHQKQQRHDNCTFANPKSSIPAMLLLLECPELEQLAEFEQKRNYRRTYKWLTDFYRNDEIDEIIVRMFYASDAKSVQFYAKLVKIVINEHHGKGRGFVKDRKDLARAVSLYRRSTDAVKSLLSQDTIFTDLMKGLENEYEAKVRTSPPGLKDIPNTYLINYGRTNREHKITVTNSFITAIDGRPTPKMPFSYGMAKKMIPRVA